MLSAQNMLFFGAAVSESVTPTASTPKATGERHATGDFGGLLASAESKLQKADTPLDQTGRQYRNMVADNTPMAFAGMVLPALEAMPLSGDASTTGTSDVPVDLVSEKTAMPVVPTLPDEFAMMLTENGGATKTNSDTAVVLTTSNNNSILNNTDTSERVEIGLVMEKTPIARNLQAVWPATDSGQEAIRLGALADRMAASAKADLMASTIDQSRTTVAMPSLTPAGSNMLETAARMESDVVMSRFDAPDPFSNSESLSSTAEDNKIANAKVVENAIAIASDTRAVSGRNGTGPMFNHLVSALHVKQVRTAVSHVSREHHAPAGQSQSTAIQSDTAKPLSPMTASGSAPSAAPATGNELSAEMPCVQSDQSAPQPETGERMMSNTEVQSSFLETVEKTNGRSAGIVSDATTVRTSDIANDHLANLNTLPVDKTDPMPVKSETTPVRFVMPTDIDQRPVRSGQSVTIRMEPEHLGQVRLTLSEYRDSIVGRLVVENHAARTVVESHLQMLYDQLTDRGINLDAFQVFVGGDGSASLARRHHNENTRRTNGGSGLSISAPVGDAVASSRSDGGLYINATGVNWVA
ncbi:MAG: flagellar hook-length control protein FliK [candidate division Zixibacteria bacterium]|nr:flagellar hook-length control protein FliK [candidate division Zixibacteria bacterium]